MFAIQLGELTLLWGLKEVKYTFANHSRLKKNSCLVHVIGEDN